MADKDRRSIDNAISWSDDDDVIEIRSRRRSVEGGKGLSRSGGASRPAQSRSATAAAASASGAQRTSAARTVEGAQRADERTARKVEGAQRADEKTARKVEGAQRADEKTARKIEGAQRADEKTARTVEGAQRTARPAANASRRASPARRAPESAWVIPESAANASPDRAASSRAAASAARPQGARRQAAPSDAPRRTQRTAQGAERPQNAHQRSAGGASRSRAQSERSVPRASQDERRAYDDGASGTARRVPTGRTRKSDKITVGCVIRRSLLVAGTALLLVVALVFAVVGVIAYGPSETARNKAVMSAMQASATKWVPGLFLSDETVNKIIEDSKVVVTDVKKITDVGGGEDAPAAVTEDKWDKAIDGMLLEFINGKTFKGYVLLIKDPSRVTVAVKNKNDFSTAARIFEITEQYNALAAINGGEFPDNGVTTLANPIGLTYSGGECVWNDGLPRTFMGFTKDNKLVVEEGTTKARADELGIRDAVAFQTGNTLITNDGENVTYYYADSNTGVAQRTAIGQLADGTVMFLVTDGRTAQSLGATKNDIIDTFIEYGAVTAGMLDGGSSAMLWYRDWYTKYNVDQSKLDDWQLKGLVNVYKAFTNPRAIPSYFIVN